ncbi:hypothetical protein PFISCL1PPCAC_25064, partial [Pristionchus fissidentatus]
RICPKDMPSQYWMFQQLKSQLTSIMNTKELLQPIKKRLDVERMVATSFNDRTNYGSIQALTHALIKVGPNSLIRCYVEASLPKFIRMFWKQTDFRPSWARFAKTTLADLIMEKLMHNKTSIIRAMAEFTKVFMATKIPQEQETLQDKLNNNFEEVLRDDTLIMNLMKR